MSIPRIRGPYPVGLTYCKVPIPKTRFGTAKFKASQQPAFVLEEVAFQLFYPCDPASGKATFGSRWLDKPLAQWADGYATFLGRSRWLFYPFVLILYALLRIPVYVGASLKKPPPEVKQWPLIFFSHGLAGTSKTYSQLCGKLAAEGNIVIAMEHRDGTAPVCRFPVDGKVEPHHYIKVEELDWEDIITNPTTPMPLRTQQLEIRYHEILEAFKAIKSIIQGNTSCLLDSQEYTQWDSWKDQVKTDSIVFTGHSFGGCTTIHVLTSPVPEGYEPLPISKAVLHDPWMEPFPEVSEDQEAASKSASVPIIVINSEEFTVWKQHFVSQTRTFDPWIKRAGQGSTWMTLARSRHMAFSDFSVFFFPKTVPMALHEDMHQLTLHFLNGTLSSYFQTNEKRITRELVIDNPDDNKRKRMHANVGDIVIHSTTA